MAMPGELVHNTTLRCWGFLILSRLCRSLRSGVINLRAAIEPPLTAPPVYRDEYRAADVGRGRYILRRSERGVQAACRRVVKAWLCGSTGRRPGVNIQNPAGSLVLKRNARHLKKGGGWWTPPSNCSR